MPAHEIRDDPGAQRLELLVDGDVASLLDYRTEPAPGGGEVRALLHVETAPAFARQGLATELVAATLARLRAEGVRIRPSCPFVLAYLRDHPADLDLVAA